MPVFPTSFFVPPSSSVPFLLEDIYVRGGFRVVSTLADRDEIHNFSRKEGMWVVVQEDNTIYELAGGTANANWRPVEMNKYALPSRNTLSVEPGPVQPDSYIDVTLPAGRTLMLLDVTANMANIQIDCHQTAARNDENPYRFVSKTSRLSDTGITVLEDGSELKKRRFSFLANAENPSTDETYWRIWNQNSVEVTPVISVKYIVLEK